MLNFQQALGDGIYAADDGPRFVILGSAVGKSSVSRMRFGVGGWVAGSRLSGPTLEVFTPSLYNTNVHTGYKNV